MDNISFGDWIEVAGERPWWLRNGEPYQIGGEAPVFYSRTDPDYYWGGTTRMRVRADHPYYTAKPSTPSNEELTQREIGDAAITLVRWLADKPSHGEVHARAAEYAEFVRRAKAFVSDLPKPVDPIDPDEAEAFAVEAQVTGNTVFDDPIDMQRAIALAGIKRGRTLAAGGTAHE